MQMFPVTCRVTNEQVSISRAENNQDDRTKLWNITSDAYRRNRNNICVVTAVRRDTARRANRALEDALSCCKRHAVFNTSTGEDSESETTKLLMTNMILARRHLDAIDNDFCHDWMSQVVGKPCVCVRNDQYATDYLDASFWEGVVKRSEHGAGVAGSMPFAVHFHRSRRGHFGSLASWVSVPFAINYSVEASLEDVTEWIICGEEIRRLWTKKTKRTADELRHQF